MQRLWVAALVVAVTASLGAQQKSPMTPGTYETAHLTIATSVAPEPATAGKRVSLLADVVPKPKMHVYAPGQAGYIAIALTLDTDPAFTVGKAKYPPGQKMLIKILNETQLVYAKPFQIAQDVTIRPGSWQAAGDAAPLTIKGTIRYQACDDKVCYLPIKVPVVWSVKPAPGR